MGRPPWNIIFPFAVWLNWKQRNQVFKHKGPSPNLAKTIKMQASEFFLCINRPKCNNYRIIKQVRWEKPRSGWLKLNTDGSYDDSLGNAGGGGVIIDEYGNWVVGGSLGKWRGPAVLLPKPGLSETTFCYVSK